MDALGAEILDQLARKDRASRLEIHGGRFIGAGDGGLIHRGPRGDLLPIEMSGEYRGDNRDHHRNEPGPRDGGDTLGDLLANVESRTPFAPFANNGLDFGAGELRARAGAATSV